MAELTAMAPLVRTLAAAVQTMTRRLSTVSPTGPADSAPARKGTSWARLTAPTWRVECVSP